MDYPIYAPSPNVAPRGDETLESRVNPLFAGVGALCAEVLRPAGVDGVAAAVLSHVTQSRELAQATDDVAQQLDELQYTIGEGPCFDASSMTSRSSTPNWIESAIRRRVGPPLPLATQLGVHALFVSPCPTVSDPWASWSCTGGPLAASPAPNTTPRQPAPPRSRHCCGPTGRHVYRSQAARRRRTRRRRNLRRFKPRPRCVYPDAGTRRSGHGGRAAGDFSRPGRRSAASPLLRERTDPVLRRSRHHRPPLHASQLTRRHTRTLKACLRALG
jgi:hypothetical protein